MKFQIEKIHEKGRRENNEDFLLSHELGNFFLVCDGVGGSQKGEVASQLAAESFKEFLSDKGKIIPKDLEKALLHTEKEFDNYSKKYPESEGMATTLTFLQFQRDKAIVAHCGDSRIYHIRDGEILFQSKDHSFVQELVDSGYITQEQALTHPKRNQITQAIQGSFKPAKLDIRLLDDIRENDLFMLCSDGILEGITEAFITENFKSKTDLKELKTKIIKVCEEKSNDNFTAFIISLKEDKTALEVNKEFVSTPTDNEKTKFKPEIGKENKSKLWLFFPLILLLAGGLYFYFNSEKTPEVSNEQIMETEESLKIDEKNENSVEESQTSVDGEEFDGDDASVEENKIISSSTEEKSEEDLLVLENWKSDFEKQFKNFSDKRIAPEIRLKSLEELMNEVQFKSDNSEEMKLLTDKHIALQKEVNEKKSKPKENQAEKAIQKDEKVNEKPDENEPNNANNDENQNTDEE